MITGPRYKKARRLGASVFEKTQTQKFALRSDKKPGSRKLAGSDFGLQLLEKQKARTTYGINERQFQKIVEKILNTKGANSTEALVSALETRLDNAVFRLGFANSRQAARQLVSHGHIDVNGKRMTVPSYAVKVGDMISIRPRSSKKNIFTNLDAKLKEARVPSWLSLNLEKKEGKVQGMPKMAPNELSFDIPQIIQYYSK